MLAKLGPRKRIRLSRSGAWTPGENEEAVQIFDISYFAKKTRAIKKSHDVNR